VLLGEPEHADDVHRIAAEDLGIGDVDAVVVDDEIVGLGQRAAPARLELRHHAAEHRRALGLPVLQRRAQDGGEVADVLCGQEVMLHEALDFAHARTLGVAEPQRDLALDIE
jgi:hypothetical protein